MVAADLFRALGDPTRLRALMLLRSMELAVGELALVLGQSQPRVSQHIKILLDAGLVERRKEGNWVFLSLGAEERVQPLLAMLDQWTSLDGDDPWFSADAARLAAIRADRAAEAQQAIARLEPRWRELRSSHVPDSQVEAAIGAALRDHSIGRLIDIGTGTGRMLELFAPVAKSAIGIDRSPEMLRVARAALAQADVRADLRQGDMYALPLLDRSVDTIIFHQVLHYAQHPEAAIGEAARILAPGGRLLIVDVGPHGREDFRERFGHVRLGFADDQVRSWLRSAGLKARVVDHLAGPELTVTIWSGDRSKAAQLRAA